MPTQNVHVKNFPASSGFTLVELMIVVGIIGILVSIAGPQFARYSSKARQSEAKIGLAAIYSLEKSFYSEYGGYVPSMEAIGFSPEGSRRFYRIGAVDGAVYTGTISGYSGSVGFPQYTPEGLPAGHSTCLLSVEPSTDCPGSNTAPFDVNNPQGFLFCASGELRPGIGCDLWQMDNLKSLRNLRIRL